MGTIRLGVETEWLQDGRAFRIVRQLGFDQFAVLDVKFNVEQTLSQSEILAGFNSGGSAIRGYDRQVHGGHINPHSHRSARSQ